jgi:hypothetical protein
VAAGCIAPDDAGLEDRAPFLRTPATRGAALMEARRNR